MFAIINNIPHALREHTRLSRNYILKTVVRIFPVPLDRFCSNSQGLCKKVLSSEPGELYEKKNLFSFYL